MVSRVELHRRWIDREKWRGRDGRPDFCEWCEKSIWFWRSRARMVRTIDPNFGGGGRKGPKALGRAVWVHERCAQHMKADGLTDERSY